MLWKVTAALLLFIFIFSEEEKNPRPRFKRGFFVSEFHRAPQRI